MNDTDLIRRALVKHNRDLLLNQTDTGEEELDHSHRMYRAGVRDLARRLMLAPAHPMQEPPNPSVTAGAMGLLPCPFCGNEPYRDSSADCTGGPMVGCLCGAHVSGYRLQHDADAAWNLRSAPPVGARVRPLVWKQAGGDVKPGEAFSAWGHLSFAPTTIYLTHNGWWLSVDCKNYPTLEDAKAAAQADYESRILAALLPAGEGE